MDENPYQAAQSPTPAIDRGGHIWPSIVVTCLLLMLNVATAGVFAWAAWYRLENTEAMGRMLVPPTIPLQLIDCILIATGIVGAILGVCTVAMLVPTMHRVTDGGPHTVGGRVL